MSDPARYRHPGPTSRGSSLTFTENRPLLVGIVAAAVALVAVAAFLVLRREGEPIATPTPTPTPTPSPTPVAHPPVSGEVEVESTVVSNGPINFRVGDGRHEAPPVDPEAVVAFAEEIADWLDRHLTDLQDDGEGLLEEVAADGLLDAGGDAHLGLTAELATHDDPIEAASYLIVVMVDGRPEWAQVRVDVTRDGGERRSAELSFVATADGPRLLAGGPVDPDAPPIEHLPHPEADRWTR